MIVGLSRSLRIVLFALLAPGLVSFPGESRSASAEQLFRLRNGLVIRGSMAEIATLKDGFGAASASQSNVRPIWLIDDGLRRVYIHGKGMTDKGIQGEIRTWHEVWCRH